ncbi:macro domain-containing protein [bacterium]|nr:macro domain-containing protein [bacterium]
MNIVLTAMDRELAAEWTAHCGRLEGVRVHSGSILDVECDAVVSPANSFGFMDRGIDRLYTEHFGPGVQERLRAVIREHHHGELLVGTAEVVETGHAGIPYLIAAPTMRVPMILRESVHPYLAARAAILLVARGTFRTGARAGVPIREHIRTIAFPGLGTGVGRVPASVCARQMGGAIRACREPASMPTGWLEAQTKHQLLYGDRARDLQFE